MKLLIAILALLLSTSAFPQSGINIGNWTVHKSLEGVQIAVTSNGAGSSVGILCNTSSAVCTAYVIFSEISCKLDATYPMMINSAVGAYPITTTCSKIEGTDLTNLQIITEFDRVRSALESGGEVGFVMPLASGQFRVIRFSTIGATAAIKEAMLLPQNSPSPSQKPVIPEQTL